MKRQINLEWKRLYSMTNAENIIPKRRSKYKKFRLRTVEEAKQLLESEKRYEIYMKDLERYANREIKETEFIKEYKKKKEDSKFNRRFIVGSKERIIKRTRDIYGELMAVVWQYGSPMMNYNMSGCW